MKRAFIILPILLYGAVAYSAENEPAHTSKYAGEENRTIKSLSANDIEELRKGAGWGLAKAAELNGVPGPVHLLEMKDKIGLSADQLQDIEQLYKQMKAEAIVQGERFIALELELELLFRSGTITQAALREKLGKIANARMELRFTHLATHLKTPGILSKAQIGQYNQLRGYLDTDPCANIPEGHNAEMWRRHNGCD